MEQDFESLQGQEDLNIAPISFEDMPLGEEGFEPDVSMTNFSEEPEPITTMNETQPDGVAPLVEEPPAEEPEPIKIERKTIRRKKNMKYGLKEVADVIFFDIKSNRPVIVFDTLKVSNIENSAESAEATGGKGNAPLISWDFGRSATLTMQDALLSDASLALLAGSTVQDGTAKNITRYEVVVAGATGKIVTTHEPVGEITAFDGADGNLGTPWTVTGSDTTLAVTEATEGDLVALFYESLAGPDATVVTFSSDKFPSIYKVVGTSLVRDEEGVDHAFQFIIPRAKLQSGFTFTMDPENVSTFDFNLNVLVNSGDKKLYDIVRM